MQNHSNGTHVVLPREVIRIICIVSYRIRGEDVFERRHRVNSDISELRHSHRQEILYACIAGGQYMLTVGLAQHINDGRWNVSGGNKEHATPCTQDA